jgi:hypothetical protein
VSLDEVVQHLLDAPFARQGVRPGRGLADAPGNAFKRGKRRGHALADQGDGELGAVLAEVGERPLLLRSERC